jgi:ArsR family transcriptional regulator
MWAVGSTSACVGLGKRAWRSASFTFLVIAALLLYRYLTMARTDTIGCIPGSDDTPDLRPVEGPEADAELAALAKALAHPARIRILRFLTRRNASICGEIVDELDLAQSTVSQHLKVMKEAGLVQGEVDGPRVCYYLNSRTLRRLKALIGGL